MNEKSRKNDRLEGRGIGGRGKEGVWKTLPLTHVLPLLKRNII